ncbi:MAG: hypothetical protein JW900_01330 [Anaerolineae bacterium]|nr:hypothetical protein [Anaerolineae bacterium]
MKRFPAGPVALAFGALLLALGAVYLGTACTAAGNRVVAPLDDAYITFQYARQFARGFPYRFNDVDPPTTGMTSPLFGYTLGLAYWLGFTDERLVALAVGLGVVWLALAAGLSYLLARQLVPQAEESCWWAVAAAALVALSGAVQWSCFNGMETGLFTVLTLAALVAWLSDRAALAAAWLGLAALTRPEGLILALLVWAVALLEGWFARSWRWRRQLFFSLAVGVGLAPFVVNWLLTGAASSAGLAAKSWWLNVPWYPDEIVRSIAMSYQRILLGLFLGWQPVVRWFAPPGLLLLALLGWWGLARQRRWPALALTMAWFAVGALSTATLITATWHMGRYQAPFLPLLIVLAACGLCFLQRKLPLQWRRGTGMAAGLALLLFSLWSTGYYAGVYRRAVDTVARQQLRLADWLRENLPPDARVGVHDTGSLRYVGQRPTYDLIGLTTAGATVAWRHGAGSVYEAMESSPMRPDYFAIYPDVFSIPYLAATDLFAQELFRVEVPEALVASAGPLQGVWRADWRLADSGAAFYQPDVQQRVAGLALVDRLDVADLADEAAHGLEWWQEERRPGFPTEVWQMACCSLPAAEVLDGGRLLTGGLAFDVATRPGVPLWIVARLHSQGRGSVSVAVDGVEVGHWAHPPLPGCWLETVFPVAGERIVGERTRILLRVDAGGPDASHYAPYTFWFLQGAGDQVEPQVPHRLDVLFAQELSLLGFDLPQQSWHPGDSLPVTTYWQAAAPSDSEAKLFVHLYDARGVLGSQADGWPVSGTRPPYTWLPGEVVVDLRWLALPPDLPPGRYSVEVGLYHPDGSGRLAAGRDGGVYPEGRVPLLTVDVVE